jgi:ABC-2 type transport system permease protein
VNGALHLIRKELRQVFRDPTMLRIIFVVPLFQLLILGNAIRTDVKNLAMMICDRDRTSVSRDLSDRFLHTEHFDVRRVIGDARGLEGYLRRGEAAILLVIPEHFARDLAAGRSPELQVLVDGQNANISGIALGYCTRIIHRFTRDEIERRAARLPAVRRDVRIVTAETRVWYNPELRSVYYMIPGIVSMLLTIITMMLTGLAIVKEREIGTLEQLLVTPLRPWQIIAGKTVPFVMLGIVEMAIATTLGIVIFKIPFAGNVAVLALMAFVYIFTTLGLGIFISTVAASQQQAMFMTWFFMMTFIQLSGIFYPIENMPYWVQLITLANPLRHFIAMVREIFLKGAGISDLWFELRWLAGIGIVVFTLAVLRFHKRAA